MLPDETYFRIPELAPARHLQRAGQWDLALHAIGNASFQMAAALRAEILVDRHSWRLDPPAEAIAAAQPLDDSDRPLFVFLMAQLAYWQRAFELGGAPILPDLRAAFAEASRDERLHGWAVFFDSLVQQYLDQDETGALAGFAGALSVARERGDLLLESYALRHQGEMHMAADPAKAVGLLRLSLYLRAALGARPQSAAGQATLAEALGDDPEAAQLRRAAAHSAAELGLTWLKSGLALVGQARAPVDAVQQGINLFLSGHVPRLLVNSQGLLGVIGGDGKSLREQFQLRDSDQGITLDGPIAHLDGDMERAASVRQPGFPVSDVQSGSRAREQRAGDELGGPLLLG
jgi:hypothetical protein